MSSVRTANLLVFVLAASSAFGLYWLSSLVLQARNATTHFGADAHVYALLAQGVAEDGLTRFHPVTIVLGLAWMKLTNQLTLWMPAHVLKALFAAVGAVGLWGGPSAFAFALLEFVVNGWLVAAEANPSRASHLSMLFYYLSRNEFSIASVYEFLMQWLFFNIVAPTPDATYGADSSLHFAGNFPPTLANYFSSSVSGRLALLAD